MTIVGTRPEIIRLSRVIPLLDAQSDHVLVHTGQNFVPELSDVFFTELGVRPPDRHLGIRAPSFARQIALILERVDEALAELEPDRVVILGDTNSGLAAVVAARRRIPVFHLEAGNRCYDDRVPEELNRRVIDHSSTVLMPYTQRSMENLCREGIERDRIFVVGNPIQEVLLAYADRIDRSDVLQRLGLRSQRYLVATMHRAENVDEPRRLLRLLTGFDRLIRELSLEVVWAVHPRTSERLDALSFTPDPRLRVVSALGFIDFVRLEREAACVITDSGTVQEECCLLHVPNVTIRDVTERPETVEVGSNILAGSEPEDLLRATALARALPRTWEAPAEYRVANASTAIVKIVLGRLSLRAFA